MIRAFLFCISFLWIGFASAQQTKFFRTYSMGLFDVGEAVIPINDTNYVVAGTTNVTGMNGTDVLLFQTNSTGDVMWWKNYGGTGIQSAKSLVMAVDSSGYFITGYKNNFDSTGYDIWLLKTDLNGDTLWTKTYGGSNWEVSYSINKLPDSTYIIAGETFSFGSGLRDMYAIHIDANGDTLWTRTYGGTQNDIAKYVMVDKYNNMLLVGHTESFGAGNSDAYLVYIDINGDTIWTRTIGTTDNDYGYSADMYSDTSGAMEFAIGYTSYYPNDSAQNSYILLIDSIAGNSIALYPQLVPNDEILDHIKIRQGDPGEIYMTADIKYNWNQISIIYNQKTSYGLVQVAQQTYGSGGNESTNPNDIYMTLDKGYILTGYSENWGPGPTSCFLLKTDSMIQAPNVPVISVEEEKENSLTIFPNPVEGNYFYINANTKIIEVKIFNLMGQLIKTYSTGENAQSVTLEKPSVLSGIYLVEVILQGSRVCRKIIF